MLDLPRYLLGIAEIGLLAGFATLGASALRSRLLPSFAGAPAYLATAVLALALVLWSAELLGSFGLMDPVPLLLTVSLIGAGAWALLRRVASGEGGRGRPRPQRPPHPATGPAGRSTDVSALIALTIAAVAIVKFGLDVRPKLTTGMTGFDSTWYHGPFATGFFQTGHTFDLHYIAPQFLAWLYPANAEIFHAIGMLAFDRDVLSSLLNLGWFAGCLVAVWCIGRPYGVGLFSLLLAVWALKASALADQAGEARNDIVGIFFLLAAAAIAVNAWAARGEGERGLPIGALVVVGLAAGLAAGTKLNFLLPAAALIAGLVVIAPKAGRWRAFAAAALAAVAGGGYWYLRNLVRTGNPLPWVKDLGPISLPAPEQALGGREGHSVLGYLTDGAVWSDWFLPGLNHGLVLWPLFLPLAFAGLVLCFGRRASPMLRVLGSVGLAAALAWLVAPTSASGPEGMPRGFESGLRYLVPALVLGLALLPLTPPLRARLRRWVGLEPGASDSREGIFPRKAVVVATAVLLALAVAIGYPVQRHYLENRYADPSFTAPGLNAAFKWARSISSARIATTSTRQYPLFGPDLSNHVQFVGEEQPHGGFTAPANCPAWRRLLNAGNYDYVVASRDRIEPGKPAYPATAGWTEAPGVETVLRTPPTVVFQLRTRLDPSACR